MLTVIKSFYMQLELYSRRDTDMVTRPRSQLKFYPMMPFIIILLFHFVVIDFFFVFINTVYIYLYSGVIL